MDVTNAEIDPQRHDRYLGVIGAHSDPVGQAMLAMAKMSGEAARSLEPAAFSSAADAMQEVRATAATFLEAHGNGKKQLFEGCKLDPADRLQH
jgi:hypothetical protein